MHADGGGLYLRVGKLDSKLWIFRYRRGQKLHDIGGGSFNDYTLEEAREWARDQRRLRHDGRDPLAEKPRIRRERKAARTFRAFAEEHFAGIKAGWKNPSHAKAWWNTLVTYVFPVIGDRPVGDIDVAAVLRVIKPHWETKTITIDRVRARIEAVLAWAMTHGFRSGDNPARWKGNLATTLPKKSKVAKVERFAALPNSELPAFMAKLRERNSVAAAALEFAILTCARSGECLVRSGQKSTGTPARGRSPPSG